MLTSQRPATRYRYRELDPLESMPVSASSCVRQFRGLCGAKTVIEFPRDAQRAEAGVLARRHPANSQSVRRPPALLGANRIVRTPPGIFVLRSDCAQDAAKAAGKSDPARSDPAGADLSFQKTGRRGAPAR